VNTRRSRNALSGRWDVESWVPQMPSGLLMNATSDLAHLYWFAEEPGDGVRFVWDGTPGAPFELTPQQSSDWIVEDPAGLHVAYFGHHDGNPFVGIDGAERAYEDITRSVPPTFSTDGSRLAYGARIDGSMRLVVDGEPLADWLVAPAPPVFSPDGRRLAFIAHNREGQPDERPRDYHQFVVVDGQPQPTYDSIAQPPDGLMFSPDGRRVAYLGRNGDMYRVVLDGVEQTPYPDCAAPTFSRDGSRFAFIARPGRKRMRLVEDDVAGPEFRAVGPPVFSPDSRRLAYFANTPQSRMALMLDGERVDEVKDSWANVVFSPDSRRYAYLAAVPGSGLLGRLHTSYRLVVDGSPGSTWDEVGSGPHWSPDSRHVAFSARRGKSWSMVVDDEPGPAYQKVGPPRYSSAGMLVHLALSESGFSIVRDGRPGPSFAEPTDLGGSDLPFAISPDGQHVASAGRFDDRWRPIVDDWVGPPCLAVGRVRFDGSRVVFVALMGNGFHRVSIDTAG
jgi:Tol biopolymer transport system component